jgi:MFS transporter, DHA1 family, multidrug resistance protein
MLLIPLSGMGIDLYSPSLPAIAVYMHCSTSLVKFSLSAFMIGFGISQFTSGLLSDSLGRKKVLTAGLIIFLIASALAILTTHIYALIILRMLQGLGAATASVNAKTILTDTFTGKLLKKTTSYLVVFWALGPILGPLIGAYLQYHFNWQANFIFYCCYSSLLLGLVIFFLEETLQKPVKWSSRNIRNNIKTIILDRKFVSGTSICALNYSLLVAFTLMTTFIIQHPPLSLKPTIFGHLALLVGIAYLTGALSNRLLTQYFTTDSITLFSCLAAFIITAIAFIASLQYPQLSLIKITIISTSLIFFTGITQPAMLAEVLSLYPKISGSANAILGSLISLIGFIVTAIISLFSINNLHHYTLCYTLISLSMLLIWWFAWRNSSHNKSH